jgi:transcriptional regulator with XRE-family HTH domain
MTPAQCRAARALLDITQTQLANAAKLGLSTVVDFEKERRRVSPDSLDAIKATLEANGISFLDENGGGVGVRFRKLTHARLKVSEKQLRPSLHEGPKGSPRTTSSRSRLSMPKVLNDANGIPVDRATLTSEVTRAARALLRWTQRDLSAASLVSLATIKRLESKPGVLAANATTVAALRRALEEAGIEFTKGTSPGVKPKEVPGSAAADQRRRGRKQEPQR